MIPSIIDKIEDLTFLVQIKLVVCARALILFMVVCACSRFVNAGRSSENSCQQVLIVLDYILLLKWMRVGSYGNSTISKTTPTPIKRW